MAQECDNDLNVRVSVVDDAIVVTTPGTSYSVTYRKRHEPWLLASDIRDDKNPSANGPFERVLGQQRMTGRAS